MAANRAVANEAVPNGVVANRVVANGVVTKAAVVKAGGTTVALPTRQRTQRIDPETKKPMVDAKGHPI